MKFMSMAGLSTVVVFVCAAGAWGQSPDAEAARWRAEAAILKKQLAWMPDKIKELEAEVASLKAERDGLNDEVGRLRVLMAKKGVESGDTGGGATYYVVPVKHEIGFVFSAAKMRRHLEDAAKLSPTVVVLEIDTPGGDIAATEEMVNMLISFKGMRLVALVRKGLSAGAAIAMACPEIYVTDSAVLGATTSWTIGPAALPKPLEEKFQSVWRATARKAAENGGHATIIAEAMADTDFALTMRKEGEKIVLERNGQGKVVKAKGRILAMTAREAVDCGLAKDVANDFDALAAKLGMSGWRQVEAPKEAEAPVSLRGPLGELTPAALCAAVSQKAEELGLAKDSMTDMQRTEAYKAINDWFHGQKFEGSRVRWTMELAEAKSENFRSTSSEQIRENLLIIRANVDTVKQLLAQAYRANNKPAITYYREKMAEFKKADARLSKMLRLAKDYPLMLTAVGGRDKQVLIGAWVAAGAKEQVKKLSIGDKFTIEGVVADTMGGMGPGGEWQLLVILDECRLIEHQ